ncbi:MAG TPA: alpha/beta hydrolase, partial [Acidimicrobiia bacterium]|nr:alpha/beta hydrolase [Acidimicrobiia bacterium]
PQPMHTDPVAARSGPFGQLTASGRHTLAVECRLHQEARQYAFVAGLGFELIRFPAPVFPGDALSFRGEVLALRPSRSRPAAGIATFGTYPRIFSTLLAPLTQRIGHPLRRIEEEHIHRQSSPQASTTTIAWLERENRAIDKKIKRYAAWAAPDRQFLLFDPKGAGRIAEVHGDLDAAANLAVVVPGMSNDQGNFEHLSGNAHNVYERSGKADPGTTAATIAWLGYHSPHGADVLVGTNAEKGGRALADFVRGLSVHGDKHLTLIGHSYGTTVVANAVSHRGVHADDLIFVGSPGFGDDHVNLGDARLWYGQAKGDPVCFFGPDDKGAGPADYGATRFPTNRANGHSEYFKRGTRSLESIADITAETYRP